MEAILFLPEKDDIMPIGGIPDHIVAALHPGTTLYIDSAMLQIEDTELLGVPRNVTVKFRVTKPLRFNGYPVGKPGYKTSGWNVYIDCELVQ